ncbi:uncharacterized protein EI97DRAFT_397138 [Westerdykella ornata]
MNSGRPFTRSTQKFFRPAFDLLNNYNSAIRKTPLSSNRKRSHQQERPQARRTGSTSSLDDTDHDDIEHYAQMESGRTSHSSKNSQSELQPPLPLIDIGSASGSRAPSPYPRVRSAVQSEDEDDEFEPPSSIRPLVSSDVASGGRGWNGIMRQGGLGGFFLGTWMGWQIWVGLLVFWVVGCSFGLLLMNRFILITGVYKFSYPLTSTYLQFIFTHLLLIGFSSLTRGLGGPLRRWGFGAAVAPAYASAPAGGAYRQPNRKPSARQVGRWLVSGTGGIAGGGLFEFETKVAKQVLPLAIVFVARVLLSNVSFAYADLSVYQLARIGVTPFACILSCVLQKENHSPSTLSAALIATLNLLFAAIRTNVRVTPDSIVAGVFSSIFVALYPIFLLRTYRTLVAGLVPQGDLLTNYYSVDGCNPDISNREETRAYYRVLHYTSLLSILLLTPMVLISGELPDILRNIYFLDVPFFWFMVLCGALGSFAVLVSTLLLVKATSPLTFTFLAVPRGALQLMLLSRFRMPAHSWVGVALCVVSSLWFAVARREEGRVAGRLRLEGR